MVVKLGREGAPVLEFFTSQQDFWQLFMPWNAFATVIQYD